MLLLLTACNSEALQPDDTNHNLPINIGNLEVAGNQTTRAGEDGLSDWYQGDELMVEGVGTSPDPFTNMAFFTHTPHGTWKVKSVTTIKQVGDITDLTAATTFNASKGSGGSDQSTWQKYHNADVIEGKLYLDEATGQLYTDADKAGKLDHINADVVITIAVPTTDNPWQAGEFENHIRHAKIEVHSTATDADDKPLRYIPWLSEVTPEGATLRVHMRPSHVPASGKTIITITPADGSNPVTGTYTTTGTIGANKRLIITFANYKNQRTLTATAKVIPWADGGSNDLTHLGWDGYNFIISNEADLQAFRKAVNNGKTDATTKAIQVKDITLTEANWTPIGNNSSAPFAGTYNGNGHTITGLKITGNNNCQGLFGNTYGATLTGINLTGVDVSGCISVGALVGFVNGGTISYCSATGTQVKGTENNTGGLVGYTYACNIVACWADVPVEGNTYIGGLVGCHDGNVIAFCYARGTVTANANCGGGLVGGNKSKIYSCYATGTVTVTVNYKGSLVGWNNSGTITHSYGGASGLKMIGEPATDNPAGTAGTIVRSYSGTHVVGGVTFTKSIWGPGDTPQLTWQ